jgi:hypothetical protein
LSQGELTDGKWGEGGEEGGGGRGTRTSLKNDENVPAKKLIFFVAVLKVTDKKAGFGAGSVSQRYGSMDPDLYQNVTDLEHWWSPTVFCSSKLPSPRGLRMIPTVFLSWVVPEVGCPRNKQK